MKKKNNLVNIEKYDLIDDIMKSKLVRVLKITTIVVGGIYAFGVGCKIVNFSMNNYLELKKTLQ